MVNKLQLRLPVMLVIALVIIEIVNYLGSLILSYLGLTYKLWWWMFILPLTIGIFLLIIGIAGLVEEFRRQKRYQLKLRPTRLAIYFALPALSFWLIVFGLWMTYVSPWPEENGYEIETYEYIGQDENKYERREYYKVINAIIKEKEPTRIEYD